MFWVYRHVGNRRWRIKNLEIRLWLGLYLTPKYLVLSCTYDNNWRNSVIWRRNTVASTPSMVAVLEPRTPELQPSTPREPFLIVLPSNKCWHSDYLSVPKTMLGCKVNHFMYSRVATLCFCIAVIQTLWFYAVSICRRCRMHCCPLKIPANLEPIYEPWMILFGETASHLSLQKHYIQSQRGANAKRQKSGMWVRSHGLVCRTLQPLTSHFSVVARLFCSILNTTACLLCGYSK